MLRFEGRNMLWWNTLLVIVAIGCLLPQPVASTLRGDEFFASEEHGRFWAFHSAGVSIVNPETCQAEVTLTQDATGKPLPEEWRDGVYMQLLGDSSAATNGYVIVNSGVVTYTPQDEALGEVLIFLASGNPPKVQARVALEGGKHHHSYGIYTRNEYWTLTEGTLSILDLEDLKDTDSYYTENQLKVTTTKLSDGGAADEASPKSGIQGQLLWNEDPYLGEFGYVVGHDKTLHIVDLEKKTQVASFDYSQFLDEGECVHGGSSKIAFSTQNKHIYVSCGRQGPTLELDISDSRTEPKFVTKHNLSGWLYEDPESGLVVATDQHDNQLFFMLPKETGQASSLVHEMDVPGHPDSASFYYHGDETVVCSPLTENVNRNNMDIDGNVVCDPYSCGPPMSPQDVAAGMCLYDAADNNRTLVRAPLEDLDRVLKEEEPYGNRCPRCKDRDSYHGGDVCTCTPHCGSCATPNYDASLTGVRCLSFPAQALLAGEKPKFETKLIKGAGAVAQEGPEFWDPPCSFGWTHRSSRRGGQYFASVAHFPANSLQIVDMLTQTKKCQVDLPGRPNTVLYVPPHEGDGQWSSTATTTTSATTASSSSASGSGSNGGTGMGKTATVVMISLIFAFIAVASVNVVYRNRPSLWRAKNEMPMPEEEFDEFTNSANNRRPSYTSAPHPEIPEIS